ncbi:isochorismate synthase [Candidatus Chloroploca asiatica]|uniref:isochorismate synthase n=1 Tax=Candidatus Chloroploca asiatica TaxID=1506545 RepID=A0A2H3KMM9_9CHLR|nr:isochorismate synthase [Candidatus Chloroploca asiatica]PDV99316.1 isochorismate synthase [Candidatus Chloroploca asiatica]
MLGMSVATTALRKVPSMEEQAELARRRARRLGRPVLVSVTAEVKVRDPLALFARGIGVTHNRLFWSVPSRGLAVAGLGAAWSFAASGPGRFAQAAEAWRDLIATAAIDADPALPFSGPMAAAGFTFDPLCPNDGGWDGYPDGLLLLPRLILATDGNRASLTVNGLVGPSTSSINLHLSAARRLRDLLGRAWRAPRIGEAVTLRDALPAGAWQAMVADAVADLRAGKLEKVVLAREVLAHTANPFDPAATLAALRRDYPETFIFAVARGGQTFLGASPERLVSLEGRTVLASSLAGSMKRGATPEEDAALGQALLASAKDRGEHAVVTRMLRAALEQVCTEVTAPDEPTLMRVRNVQHLYTPLTGQIIDQVGVLDLVERLHPTPALGGQPRETALAWIREREQLDRGWYGAPVGWIDARGQGEFAVAIRSALVGKYTARLFAGAGIVADSDPAREEQETVIKLRAMLGALGAGNV